MAIIRPEQRVQRNTPKCKNSVLAMLNTRLSMGTPIQIPAAACPLILAYLAQSIAVNCSYKEIAITSLARRNVENYSAQLKYSVGIFPTTARKG